MVAAVNGSSNVVAVSWSDVMDGNFPDSPWRAAFRAAVADVAAKAREALPDSGPRLDAAVRLVLAGDVQLHPDGSATVASGSQSDKVYTVNGTCECHDFSRAPAGFCKHRLAMGIAKRAT